LGTYAGSLAWELSAGTGQVVIAPIYSVLKQRKVGFQFFHKLSDVMVADDSDAICGLRFDRQVELRDATREYCPVSTQTGLLSWGATPDWNAIENGDELTDIDLESHWCTQAVGTVTLERGCHFDDAILAIPLGVFKRLNTDKGPCAELIKRNRRFR